MLDLNQKLLAKTLTNQVTREIKPLKEQGVPDFPFIFALAP